MAESRDLAARGTRLVELTDITAENGTLIVGQYPEQLPFAIERIFTLLSVPSGEIRGTHAHRQCHQFLICMAGRVTARVDDGTSSEEVVLDRASVGLYMPPLTWGKQYQYSADAVLVVLASHPYDANDYIHEYDEFTKLAAQR